MNDPVIINSVLADIKHRFNEHPPDPAWKEYVLDTDKNYHRYEILDQGRADFDDPFACMDTGNELALNDIIILYCYYYLQMHYESSFLVYKENAEFISDSLASRQKMVFLDFGCGPLTSGLAMAEFLRQTKASCEYHYVGIDASEGMLAFAEHMYSKFGLGPSCTRPEHFKLATHFEETLGLLQQLVEGDAADYSIFINFSYFFSSYSLNVDQLAATIADITNQYSALPICVAYQNPPRPSSLNLSWRRFRKAVAEIPHSLRPEGGEQVLPFQFTDRTGSWLPLYTQPGLRVLYEMLYNYPEA